MSNAKKHVLIVHGVQVGNDVTTFKYNEFIRNLVKGAGNDPVDFDTSIFAYERINDKATSVYKTILKYMGIGLLTRGTVVDLIGDIAIAVDDDETAHIIKHQLKTAILDIYQTGQPLYLLAHSLGTVYCFDVIQELMTEGMFDNSDKTQWPIQTFITLGSPLGLDMFDEDTVFQLEYGNPKFPWINYWDKNDPVVSGRLMANTNNISKVKENFGNIQDKGWVLIDNELDTGKGWIESHTGYWTNEELGKDLYNMLSTHT